MPRTLLVFGSKEFKITVPDNAKITFAPFSPPSKMTGYNANPGGAVGTLRIYEGTKDKTIAVFTGVGGYRDLSLDYMEQVAVEQGATIWKSDENGYSREENVSGTRKWIVPEVPKLPPGEDDDTIAF